MADTTRLTLADLLTLKGQANKEITAALQKLADAGLNPVSVYVDSAVEVSGSRKVIAAVEVRL